MSGGTNALFSVPSAALTPAPAPKLGSSSSPQAFETVDRRVISTSSLSLEVEVVQTAVSELRAIAEGLGGFVDQLSSSGSKERQRANVTIRVPQDQFFPAMERIQALGEALSQSVGSEDVSEQFIDLEARLKSALRQKESFLSLLSRAENVSEILTIGRELTRVRSDIERFQGQPNFLERWVALATISVVLSSPAPETGTPPAGALTLAVSDVGRALDEVKGLVSVLEGRIDSSLLSITEDDERAAVSFRVFASDFERAVSSVEDKGEVRAKEVREGTAPISAERAEEPDARVELLLVKDDERRTGWVIPVIVVGAVAAAGLLLLGGRTYRRRDGV